MGAIHSVFVFELWAFKSKIEAMVTAIVKINNFKTDLV